MPSSWLMSFQGRWDCSEGNASQAALLKSKEILASLPHLELYVYLHFSNVNLLQVGVCYFSSFAILAKSGVMFLCSCRCLWYVQLALGHLSSLWCALEYSAQPGILWEMCQETLFCSLDWQGVMAILGYREPLLHWLKENKATAGSQAPGKRHFLFSIILM